MLFSISREGTYIGDWDREDLETFRREGRLLPTDWYWTEGMREWSRLDTLFPSEDILPEGLKPVNKRRHVTASQIIPKLGGNSQVNPTTIKLSAFEEPLKFDSTKSLHPSQPLPFDAPETDLEPVAEPPQRLKRSILATVAVGSLGIGVLGSLTSFGGPLVESVFFAIGGLSVLGFFWLSIKEGSGNERKRDEALKLYLMQLALRGKITLDAKTRFDGAELLSDGSIEYHYTIFSTPKPTSEEIKSTWTPKLNLNYRTLLREKILKDYKVQTEHIFTDTDGVVITRILVGPQGGEVE